MSTRRRWINLRKGALRTFLPALRLLPPRAALRVVGDFGKLEYHLSGGLRAEFDAAIERHARYFGDRWDVPHVGAELAANQIRSRARDLLIDGRRTPALEGIFDVVGREHLDSARSAGKGVVLLANHYGAYLLMACWLLRHGYPWRMFGERPRHVSRLLAAEFATDGPLGQSKLFVSRRSNPSEAAAAILRAAKVLKAGYTLSIAADVRWEGPLTTQARFLGREYSFSSTWLNLAAMTGAPVVPCFCAMQPDGPYRVEFLEPFAVDRATERDPEAARALVQRSLDVIEEHVRRDPANSIDYFFWN